MLTEMCGRLGRPLPFGGILETDDDDNVVDPGDNDDASDVSERFGSEAVKVCSFYQPLQSA